jgi:glycosyltransferase involved in cell wall biosynthesis
MAQRAPRLRILSLVPFTPRVDGRHGGSRAIGQLLSRLALYHDVMVLSARWPDDPPTDELLRERCLRIEEVVAPSSRRSIVTRVGRRIRMRTALLLGTPTWASERSVGGYAQRVAELAGEWQPDIVQLEFHVMGQFLPALAATRAPRVLVQHEPGVAGAAEKGRHGVGRLRRRLEVRAWRQFEQRVMRKVDALVVFTERDRGALSTQLPGTGVQIVTIPLGIELPVRALNPSGTDPDNLLFFGSFRHQPNVDAATRLAQRIFPQIRVQRPEATLHIVGADPTSEIAELAGDGIEFLGEVPDLAPHLDRAAVVLVPLRFGGGMRVKVLEALAAGKAVVGSAVSFDGVEVVNGEHVVFAETDAEFVSAALDLLSDPSRRSRLGSNARAWAETNLSWDSRVAAYDRLYTSLLGSAHSTAVAAAH